jgi:peptide-methionine (S)-S-oxide reductase
MENQSPRTEKATFGAGCFWQVEAAYRETDGVVDTAVGYEGGTVANPTYEQVCSGETGHAEVTQVEFDPEQVSYEELLEKFWEVHDPTQVDRQGWDVGTQYRSVIFTHSPEQEAAAKASKERAQERFSAPIATSIKPAGDFWRAEEYHQCYLERRRPANALRTLIGR